MKTVKRKTERNVVNSRLRIDIKKRLKKNRRNMREFGEVLRVPYQTMNGYLNGYSGIPHNIYIKMINQFEMWERQR